MRTTWGVLAAIVLLAGCSSAKADSAPSTSPNQGDYLQLARVVVPHGTDADLIDLAQTICHALDQRRTPEDIKQRMLGTGVVNAAGTRVLLRASVAIYCPEHSDVVPPAK